MAVLPQSVFCLEEAPVKVIQFQLFNFILALETLFHLIRLTIEIKGLAIFDHCYLYSAYADDTTFFLQDTISIKYMVDDFYFFSYFSGLKPNLKVSEIAGIGAICGL